MGCNILLLISFDEAHMLELYFCLYVDFCLDIVDVVSSNICDEDREKCDYIRSISKKARRGLDWSRPSRRVIAIHPVSLYYAVRELVTPDELQAATYIYWRTAL
jgi:hypothetical protein